jgi:hypothetical protein
MVTVSIDVAAANGVVAGLRVFVNDVLDEWNDVGLVAQRGLCSTASLRGLSDPLDEMLRLGGELSTRVELAVTYNTGDKGRLPTENVLTYEVSDDTLDAVKAQLGIELAEGVQRLEPGVKVLHREDVERFEYFTTLMEKYSADAVVTDAMFNKLGPEGVVQVPIILKDFADAYQRDAHLSEGDVMWDDKTRMPQRISELQQRFLESFGASLATSTKSDAFRGANPDFAKDLAGAATRTPTGQGWGLSQVLRFGDYEPGFLTTLGTELYGWEKDQFGPVWGPQLSRTVMDWRLGTGDNGGHYDPFVGLFEAMGRTPKASLDFFNPDGGGSVAQERAKYFITDRTWRADDFNALGLALDAASTAFHRPGVSVDLQERSAWVASATISYLADRDPGRNDRRIGDAGKDSLAHILATYIYDVDRIAGGADGGLGTHPSNQNAPWDAGLPVGADFSKDDLIAVLNETLTDKGAAAQLGRATAAWNGYRIAIAADGWGGEGSDTARLQAAVNQGSRLTGFVLGAMDTGLTGEAKSADERAQTYIDLASSVVGLIPTGGTFTSFLADQALSAGGDALSDQFTGNESRVAGEQHSVREVAFTDLQIALAVALAEEGKLPSGALTNESGVTYPWFKGGQFNADSLADPSVRNDFIAWMNSGEGGQTLTALLPDVAAEFDHGVNSGSGRAR